MDKRKENKYLPLSEFQTSAQLQRCEKTENFQTFHTRKMQADGKNKGWDKDKYRDIDKDKDKDNYASRRPHHQQICMQPTPVHWKRVMHLGTGFFRTYIDLCSDFCRIIQFCKWFNGWRGDWGFRLLLFSRPCHHLLNTTTTQPPTLTQTNGNCEALIFIQSISNAK